MTQTQDNRVVTLSDLDVGDVVEVHTQNSVYRCKMKGRYGEAFVTTTSKRYPGPYEAQIMGTLDPSGVKSGLLCPGGRLYFHFSATPGGKSRDLISSAISHIVVNGGPVLANFG